MQNKHTIDELIQKQSLPLHAKVTLTKQRIREWYEHWDGNVYVSFSGGKDSSVLLHIVRSLYPNVPAVFCDTGLEFPEVRSHALSTANVTVLKPEMNFREIIEKYGWVYPGKDVALTIYYAKRGSEWAIQRLNGINKDGTPSEFKKSRYVKWRHLLDAPFEVSHKCCTYMKERPLDKYQKETGSYPIVGIMASESHRRKMAWLRTGCNSYGSKQPKCKPLSFWTEQDVLRYILDNDLKIPAVYGDIIEKNGKLQTTGAKRTGCMYCLIACHLEHPNKFQRMKETHPTIYKYCMEQLGMEEILNYLGVAH